MTDCASVVAAYRQLRDDLNGLADRCADRAQAITVRGRAVLTGELAEQCAGKFADGDVPHGDDAIADAGTASRLATATTGQDGDPVIRAIKAAARANTTLNGIVLSGVRATVFTDRFRGSLRVGASKSLPAAGLLPDAGLMGVTAGGSTGGATGGHADQPAYVASVAMLFPIEAATLFPLGQSIAGTSGSALAIVIALILSFIVVVRWFATQEEGGSAPAINEIVIAVISFLLWVGSLKGYWVAGGRVDLGVGPDLGAKLFGFATIMWVAIVPYFVREPTPAPPK